MTYVYFIMAREVSRVKIGYSKHPALRMEKMQAHSPCLLELLGEVVAPPHLERQLHTLLFADRHAGEWFNCTPNVLRVIDEILRGVFCDNEFPPVARRAWVWENRARKSESQGQAA